MGIIPRADQEHLGCVSTERSTSRGLLTGVRPEDCNRKPVSRGLCGDGGGTGSVVGGEGRGVARFSGHHGWGDGKAPADRLIGPEEFPTSGVGFCALGHP